jgi:hypothetical protein
MSPSPSVGRRRRRSWGRGTGSLGRLRSRPELASADRLYGSLQDEQVRAARTRDRTIPRGSRNELRGRRFEPGSHHIASQALLSAAGGCPERWHSGSPPLVWGRSGHPECSPVPRNLGLARKLPSLMAIFGCLKSWVGNEERRLEVPRDRYRARRRSDRGGTGPQGARHASQAA